MTADLPRTSSTGPDTDELLSDEMIDKRNAILERENVFSREFAVRALERPEPTFRALLLPFPLIPFLLRRMAYRAGAPTCIGYYLRPRLRALEIATGGNVEPDQPMNDRIGAADANYIRTLVEYYETLLSGKGPGFRDLVLSSYRTEGAYKRQLERIEAAQRDVDKALLANADADVGAKEATKMREAAERVLMVKREMHREEMVWLFGRS